MSFYESDDGMETRYNYSGMRRAIEGRLTMRERIAKALYANIGPPGLDWGEVSESSRETFLGMADAIIAELGLYEEVDSAGRTCLRCDSRWEFPTITESGKAVVESGLTTRQAHEIRTGCSPENRCADCRKWDTWGGDRGRAMTIEGL